MIRKSEDLPEKSKGTCIFTAGPAGAGGAVDIITRKVTQDTHESIGVGYGSHKAMEGHGMVTDTIGGNGFLFFASHDRWDGFKPFRGEDYDCIDRSARKEWGYYRNNLMAKYRRDLDLGKGAALNVSVLRTGVDADFMRVDEDRAVNERTEHVGILKFDRDVSDQFSYYIKTYYHEWWTDYTRQKLDGTFVFNDALWGYEDWGINIMGPWFFLGEISPADTSAMSTAPAIRALGRSITGITSSAISPASSGSEITWLTPFHCAWTTSLTGITLPMAMAGPQVPTVVPRLSSGRTQGKSWEK